MSDYQAYNARVLRAETLEDKDGQYTVRFPYPSTNSNKSVICVKMANTLYLNVCEQYFGLLTMTFEVLFARILRLFVLILTDNNGTVI
jgi:hypothetical protein